MALAACSVEREAARTYAEVTGAVQAAGGMRTERAPADAPFGAADLAQNFERIVFFTEFALEDSALIPRETEARLMKWATPIRYRLVGDAVTLDDIDAYAALARRLSAATGLSIARAGPDEDDNLLILILSRAARRQAAEFLAAANSPARAGLLYRLRGDDYSIPCAASVSTGPDSPAITQAIILIKAETAGILRESCAHEEFAQALGPGNDFDGARPSIFNDDQEFALLTAHDEMILRVLYDPRLRPGMTRAEGMPIARAIIAGLGLPD